MHTHFNILDLKQIYDTPVGEALALNETTNEDLSVVLTLLSNR